MSVKGSKHFIYLQHIVSSSASPQDVNTSESITIDFLLLDYKSFSTSTNQTNLLSGHSKIHEVKFVFLGQLFCVASV